VESYVIINEIDSWFSKGFKSEIFALASGDGELKMTFNNLMLKLSKEAENRTLRQNLYGFAAVVVRSLLYS
jgi:fucose permease